MNCYCFTGGMVDQKSPYLMKGDEALSLSNFEIENGGLTVRSGTKKLYGPFHGEVQSIHKALTPTGGELLFVQTPNYLELVADGTQCNVGMVANRFFSVHRTDGSLYLAGENAYTMKPFYRRKDGNLTIRPVLDCIVFLERLEEDISLSEAFPEDLYGKTVIDDATQRLYRCVEHTHATLENIQTLLAGSAFSLIGTLGDCYHLSYRQSAVQTLDLKTFCYTDIPDLSVMRLSQLSDIFSAVSMGGGVIAQAIHCPYLVWHPASMRYFAAGNPDHPNALYISEPYDPLTYYASNVLYPHLHLGKITGLSVVEKSVLVSYEYGWSHYVGTDPTEDGQWSLLSIPSGTKYGETVCLTPGSTSFLSEDGLMSFSSSMLTVQMIYSPSSSLYRFLSRGKLRLPKPKNRAFAYYKNGIYYLVIDDTMYLYNFALAAFTRYDGITCQCLTEDYSGRLLMGCGDYITAFADGVATDFDPQNNCDKPISYYACIPLPSPVAENEVARCEEVVVKSLAMPREFPCRIRLSAEWESGEGTLLHTNHLCFGNTDWNKHYKNSTFSETIFPWKVSGNLFFLELEGSTDPAQTTPLTIFHIYLHMKKERNKL